MGKVSREKGKKRVIAFIMAFTMVVTSLQLGTVTASAADTLSLVEWELPSISDVAASWADYKSTGADTTAVVEAVGEGVVYNGVHKSNGFQCKGLMENDYFQISFNSKGYENLKFSANLRASGTGARDYALDYRVDTGEWIAVAESQVSLTATSPQNLYSNFVLPTETADSEKIYLRVRVASSVSQKGETIQSGGGEAIGKIAITATPMTGTLVKAQTPTASATGRVAMNEEIKLTCDSSGATIYYGNSRETINQVYSNPIKITGETTIYAQARGTDFKDSDIVELSYTIKPARVPPTADDPIDTIPDQMVDINAALAAADGETITVVGQVAYKFGSTGQINSIILQDVINKEIVGFQIYDIGYSEDKYKIGDIVAVTGVVGTNGGVKQIAKTPETNISVEVLNTGAALFEPQQLTIQELLDYPEDYISEYVVIRGVTLGKYNGSGNTSITDTSTSESINIYKGAAFLDGLNEGDEAHVFCAFSKYGTTYQLRNGSDTDYESTGIIIPRAEMPTSSVSGSAIEVGTTVKLTCATSGAAIYYNTVSATGDFTSIFPEDGLTINKATTIYAIAKCKDYRDSQVAVFKYTMKDQEPVIFDPITDNDIEAGVMTIDQLYAMTDDEMKATSENKITVIGQLAYSFGSNGTLNSASIQDVINGEIIGIQVYNSLSQYEVGEVLKLTGTVTEFSGVRQIQNVSVVSVKKESPMPPQVLTINELTTNGSKYLSEYVKIKDVTLGTYTESYTKIKDSTGETNIFKSAAYPPGLDENSITDVKGVWSAYNTTYQLRNGTTASSFAGKVEIDNSVTLPVASWSGSKKPEAGTMVIYADSDKENDNLDQSAKLTNSKGAFYTNYTLTGQEKFVPGDYYQLEFSAKKYGNLTMNFDMRGSATGPKSFNILYSTDGANYMKSDKISWSYKYSVYQNNEPVEYTSSATDTDTLIMATDGKLLPYSVTLPESLNAAETVYIRIQVADDSTTIAGKPLEGKSGVNYLVNLAVRGNPVVSDEVCGIPKVSPAEGGISVGQELTFTSDTAGAAIYYSINGGEFVEYNKDSKPVLSALPATVKAYAAKNGLENSIKAVYKFTQSQVATVKISPNGGAVVAGTFVKLSTVTEDAAIKYSTDDGTTWKNYTEQIKLETFPTTIKAKATKSGYLDSEEKTVTFTLRENEDYNVYFGQIHAHTNYSDGAGSCDDAFKYAKNEAEQIDFLAITDHSNSFDNDTSANIKDGSASAEWVEGHQLADQYSDDTFVGIYGYEMTWSGGAPGHMNTFNTDGFLSRNMDGYKNGSKESLPNYYAQLKTVTDSISQFNHPGTTFGDFYDFSYYDEEIDQLITTIEVGNGEGAIGSSGYFPSYEYYTRALDKGWHVAPTNNQDNHKGRWGDANTARTVVLADSLTRDNIYDALRNMRTYASEDNNLEIQYTLNNMVMGTIFEDKPDEVQISVKLEDADNEAIGKVEVIVNSGLSIASEMVDTNKAEVNFDLAPDYSYYYIRVTQKDGDIAVTAPVWVSEVEAIGISTISTSASLPVKGESLDISTSLYNNEQGDLLVDSITYTIDDKEIHKVDLEAQPQLKKIASKETPSYTFDYVHDGLGKTSIQVEVKGTYNGIQKVYTGVLQLNYVDPSMITKVIVDGTHNNDYVTGYYGGNVGNFADIAAGDNVQVKVIKDKITTEMLEDCAVLIISAPAKKTGTYVDESYAVSHFEEDFIAMVGDYAKRGGTVILCGLADYQDSKDCQSSTEINKLLAAMGATTRLNSDELIDKTTNGGQEYRLYFTKYNMDSAYTKGIVEGQEYSAYSGAGVIVDPDAAAAGKAEALVYGHSTTESLDSRQYDSNYVNTPQGEIVALAHETVGDNGGKVFVGGTVFISDFEVKVDLDYAGQLTYSNRNILLNILGESKKRLTATDIATVRKADLGEIFAIEGYVTAGTAVEGNIFFDTIYVQDDTAGITVFPVADSGIEVGQKLHVEGFVDAYQGDKELQVITYELMDGEKKVYDPLEITTEQANDYATYGGRLVKVTGKVTKINKNGDNVQSLWVRDSSGKDAVVFIDGYILASGKDIVGSLSTGDKISAVGLLYEHPEGEVQEVCLRVRDRSEIVLVSKDNGNSGGSSSNTEVKVEPVKPTPEVPKKVEKVTAEVTTKAVTATESTDGFFYSSNGEKVTNAIVKTADGDRFILNEKGEKYVSSMITAKNGNMYITDNQGAVVTGTIVETNGARFYTTKDTGKIVTNKIFKVEGNKYIATKTGALATGKIVKVSGDIYYTTKKTGKIVTGKLFKLNGKKYYAAKSGKLAVSKWVTVDGKKYYCDKTGAVVKSK